MYSQPRTTSTSTQEFRVMLNHGEGQPTREFATLEAIQAMMSAFRATGSTREGNRVYVEVLASYGYAPLDQDGEEDDR